NAAAEVMTALSPMELLRLCQDIENRLGRVRTVKWGPRTADLDILLYGDAVMDTPELKIPHPLMHERRFVLEPLAEVAPGAVHPVTGMTISQLLDKAAA
ncbi:MAG TPA: 2-amino-4-hydroxy-6-hydroxymethyldihydropteridine diphosphokinase, partial [Nitrospirota bacterium]